LAVTGLGLALADFSVYPVGFYVTSLAFALYVLVRVARALAARTQTVAPKPAEAV
jgi:zinc/manganese transport system permease protein